MQIELRQTPSFGIARVTLAPNEQLQAESGSMMSMSPDMQLSAGMQGGLKQALKRTALGGESFFISTFAAGQGGGFVDLAAILPGDVSVLELDNTVGWFIQAGSWMASPPSVQIDTKWGGFKNLFGGEGGFILRATGTGPTIIGCYGALEAWDLQAGQTVTVDTGHMVAYQETVQMNIRKATGGMIQSFKSGEGYVFDFTGPGRVMVQTRNPQALVGFLSRMMPGSGRGETSGGIVKGLGGLLGG